MIRWNQVERLGMHDLVEVFSERTNQPLGKALVCVSQEYKDTVAMNCEWYQKAKERGIKWVIFIIDWEAEEFYEAIYRSKMNSIDAVEEILQRTQQKIGPKGSFWAIPWDDIENPTLKYHEFQRRRIYNRM